MRSVLGLRGFYLQCLPDYAQIAEPHEELKRKYAHFVWGPSQSEAFEKLSELAGKGLISPAEKKAMTQHSPREAEFYLLPKIHNSKTNPPGRPIMSGF